eukprot:5101446-Pyramimonas_sp.AAC.1
MGPSVESLVRPRNVVLGVADACGHSNVMGPRSAVLAGADACDHSHWSVRWSSLWGHDTLYCVARTHVVTATGAFGGAPYGVTKWCTGWRGRMWSQPLGPSVELPMGPRSCTGWRGRMWSQPLGRSVELRWGHETLYIVTRTHVVTATGPFGATLYGATKRCTGRRRRM